MIFTLEALNADHGDALLLHYGPNDDPGLFVIDGGPSGVFRKSLEPRLRALKAARSPDAPLDIRLLMVSHIDDDHIRGVLDLTGGLVGLKEDHEPLPWRILGLWHNAFDDIIGNRHMEVFGAGEASVRPVATGGEVPKGLGVSRESALILASVSQGRTLRQHAGRLALAANAGFKGLVKAPKKGKKAVSFEGGPRLTVVGPSEERLDALGEEWERYLEKRRREGADPAAIAAAYVDRSVANLSSIAVFAAFRGKTMLLTGDARGDDLLVGLAGAGLMKGGKLHVDLLKLPHHGSSRNVEPGFFQTVTADHYVISADGEYGNPDTATLEMIVQARGKSRYTFHLTNRFQRIAAFFDREKKKPGRAFKVVFRSPRSISVRVDLADPLRD